MNNLLCICMDMDDMLRYVTYLNILNNPRLNPNQVICEPVRYTSSRLDRFVGQTEVNWVRLNGTGLQLGKQIFKGRGTTIISSI